MTATPTKPKGFAAIAPSLQKAIAKKGGKSISQSIEHMSEIGKKGGRTVSQDRQHMAAIGRKGGAKLDVTAVRAIRKAYQGGPFTVLAEQFKVSPTTIYKIVTNRSWVGV